MSSDAIRKERATAAIMASLPESHRILPQTSEQRDALTNLGASSHRRHARPASSALQVPLPMAARVLAMYQSVYGTIKQASPLTRDVVAAVLGLDEVAAGCVCRVLTALGVLKHKDTGFFLMNDKVVRSLRYGTRVTVFLAYRSKCEGSRSQNLERDKLVEE
jgi:hypothetical protein